LQFGAADAGEDERQEHEPRLLVRERLGDAGDLGGLEDRRAERRQLRPFSTLCRVCFDEFLAPPRGEDRL
jgi:hypothetical protein